MKLKTTLIGLGLVSSLALQGCYTQLAMFHPEPVYDQDGEGQFYDTYSEAPLRPGLQGYAQDGSSAMPLGYSNMQNRFNPFFGYVDSIIIIHIIIMVMVAVMDTAMDITITDIATPLVVTICLSLLEKPKP